MRPQEEETDVTSLLAGGHPALGVIDSTAALVDALGRARDGLSVTYLLENGVRIAKICPVGPVGVMVIHHADGTETQEVHVG